MDEARDQQTRKADTLGMLATPAVDVWVATSSRQGEPHLVPVSLAWIEDRVVIAVPGTSVTARNLSASGTARLGVGPTRDVTMLDVVVDAVVAVGEEEALAAAYAGQADWDPRGDTGYVFVVLRPIRVQAWREANEIAGRTLMRDGAWLV